MADPWLLDARRSVSSPCTLWPRAPPTAAYEILNCVKGATYAGSQYKTYGAGGAWWIDRAAEAFAAAILLESPRDTNLSDAIDAVDYGRVALNEPGQVWSPPLGNSAPTPCLAAVLDERHGLCALPVGLDSRTSGKRNGLPSVKRDRRLSGRQVGAFQHRPGKLEGGTIRVWFYSPRQITLRTDGVFATGASSASVGDNLGDAPVDGERAVAVAAPMRFWSVAEGMFNTCLSAGGGMSGQITIPTSGTTGMATKGEADDGNLSVRNGCSATKMITDLPMAAGMPDMVTSYQRMSE